MRVERWGEDSGNGALAGRELPPAGVLAADQRITWWAGELRRAGLEGGTDVLRARALVDLLLGRDSRPRLDGEAAQVGDWAFDVEPFSLRPACFADYAQPVPDARYPDRNEAKLFCLMFGEPPEGKCFLFSFNAIGVCTSRSCSVVMPIGMKSRFSP